MRITPAYAGKRFYTASDDDGTQDHPCVCGEKDTAMIGKAADGGSPLRMRGKGKAKALRYMVTMDHPCVCGEKSISSS